MSLARTVNIGGDANDSNYRYKMQPLQTKIEGRGNGIKTVLLNVVEVSKDLRTLPEYTTKFFGVEMGALSKFDTKRGVGIVNGAHQSRDLQDNLRKFVNEFILCPKCRLPELQMRVKKSHCIVRCASCGHTGTLPTGHRLKQYIVNHPPTKDRAPPPRRQRQRGGRGPSVPTANEPAEVSSRSRKSQPKRPENEKAWGSRPEFEEEAKRRHADMLIVAQSRKAAARRARRDDDEQGAGNELQSLRTYISEKHSIDEICFEVDRIVRAHDFDATKKMKLIFDVVFDLDEEAVDEFIPTIEKKAELLERFTRSEKEFFLFIGCVEEILTIRQTRLADKITVSKMFLAFYENEIFDESQLLQWYESPADSSWIVTKEDAQQVRDLVAPFMEWLTEADVEEGKDGDEEDDNDIDEDAEEYVEENELTSGKTSLERPIQEEKPVETEEDIDAMLEDL